MTSRLGFRIGTQSIDRVRCEFIKRDQNLDADTHPSNYGTVTYDPSRLGQEESQPLSPRTLNSEASEQSLVSSEFILLFGRPS